MVVKQNGGEKYIFVYTAEAPSPLKHTCGLVLPYQTAKREAGGEACAGVWRSWGGNVAEARLSHIKNPQPIAKFWLPTALLFFSYSPISKTQ
jgi:hypothetical protein